MQRSEAIAIIKRGTGFRQTQDQAIIAALQEAQRDLELGKTLPTFLMKYDAEITVTADNELINLPEDFLRFSDDYDLYYLNQYSAQVFLPRKNRQEAYQAYVARGTVDDRPQDWTSNYPAVVVARGKTQAELIPTPKVSFTAYLSYYAKADTLDAEGENAWLANAPDALVGLAGMIVAGNLRDAGAMQRFQLQAKRGANALLGDIIEDELAGRPLVMGRNN